MQHDQQFEDSTVKSVRTEDTRGWSVGSSDGWSIFVDNGETATPPEVGESLRIYGKGLGYMVRGIVIGGRVYRYQSEEDAETERVAAIEASKRQRRAEFESRRESFMARVKSLPDGFFDRMRGFLATSPSWAWECGPYELFCCEEAVKIANTLGSADAVRSFAKAPQAEQKSAVPTMEFEEHSGNTFGSAVRFAVISLESPDALPKYHAAICPLIGCFDAGCWSARSNRDE